MSKTLAIIIVGAILLLGIAVALFDGYSKDEPVSATSNNAVFEHGLSLFNERKFPEALAELEKISVSEFDDWQVPYYIGSSQLMLKEYQLAANSLEQALVLDNRQTGVLYALGVAYYKLGNLKLAKAYFAAVLEINPNDGQAKGLMETMAKLERQQPGSAEEGSAQIEESGDNSH